MSADVPREVVPNRLSEVLLDALEELRADANLSAWVGNEPTERIYLGQPGDPRGFPVEIAVSAAYSGTTRRRDAEEMRFVIQCTVEASRDWRDSHSSLAFPAIIDECDRVLNRGFASGLVPQGANAVSPELEIGDGQYAAKSASWTYERTATNHDYDSQ